MGRRQIDGYWVDDDVQDADPSQAWTDFWKTVSPELARTVLDQPTEETDSRQSA